MTDVLQRTRWHPSWDSKVAGISGTGSVGLLGVPPLGLVGSDYIIGTGFFIGVGVKAGSSGCFLGGFGSLCVTCTHLLKPTGSLGGVGVLLSDSFVLAFSPLICIVSSSTRKAPTGVVEAPRLFEYSFKLRLYTHVQLRVHREPI